ncbi:MAG: thiamine-phosphate kinase [Opitutaceae bacterium]
MSAYAKAKLSARTIAELGETALIRAIKHWLGPANRAAPLGIGDDCAVLPAAKGKQLVTVDPVIRGRHFDDSHPPRLVAEKLLKRSLSDIAAMGGVPTHAVIALSAPPGLPVVWLRDFFRGLGRCAHAHGVAIVGGDCTQTDGFLGAFLTLVGHNEKRVLTRDGGRAGDALFVSGALGGSRLGRHARFTPRLAEGCWLARQSGVHAAIDLSDGLGKDLAALARPGILALVETGALPVSADARRAARKDGRALLDHMLNDGEDFELLFAVAARRAQALERAWRRQFKTPLTRIGKLVAAPQASRDRVRFDPPLPPSISAQGYEHFR